MKKDTNGRTAPNIRQVKRTKASPRGRTPDGVPNPVDVYVGNRMRLRRQLLGYSQEKMAALLGITFQQIQKYEQGRNRISASRLWDISRLLGVSADLSFEDMDKSTAEQSPRMFQLSDAKPSIEAELDVIEQDPMSRNETINLVSAYYKIPNRQTANHIYNLLLTLSTIE